MSKRKVSVLVPYRIENNSVYIFLQKRSKDAKRAPGFFGFFGGGAEEGETPEQALLREIKEELDYNLKSFDFFNKYETENVLMDLFTLKVDDNFEKEIKVLDGDYGKWFDEETFLKEKNLIMGDILILEELYEKL
ncbi:MAG: NUDIX domain-containing protein [Candidatus Pacebacteria bacterium]|nr:NUDIX domain-containing protein [Candidatus Paceibacterota bacterium]